MKEIQISKDQTIKVVPYLDFTCPICKSDNTRKVSNRDELIKTHIVANSGVAPIGAIIMLNERKFLKQHNVDKCICNRCSESFLMERNDSPKIEKELEQKQQHNQKIKKVRSIILKGFLIYSTIMIGGVMLVDILR